MNTKTLAYIQGSALVASLMLFSGCDLIKKKDVVTPKTEEASKASTKALCTINGEVAITEGEFLNNLNQMIQANPYFRGASLESLPKELLRKFFDQLAMQALIEKYSVKNNIENDPEYIKAYNETEKLLKRSLMVQVFEKKLYDNIKVSDEDITKHYNENKDRFVKVAGGVLTMGARFDNEALANAFLAKVKGDVENFEKLAKADKNGKFKDFGRVSKEVSKGFQYDAVPGPIKETALGMTKLPGVEKVKVGKEFWVIKAWDKKDTTLFELNEVRGHIESMLKNNQFKDVMDKELKKLKDDFKVVVNEEYFQEAKPAASEKADDEAKAEPKNDEKPATAA